MMDDILTILNNPIVWAGVCLLGGIIFSRKKYQKWVALAYLLVHCIEKAEASKVKQFVSSLVKGNLKKELDDVLYILEYKNRETLKGDKSLEEIDKEHLYKKFPELKLKKL